MAFTYESRTDAIDAAALLNYPEAAVSRDETGKWGFPDVDEDAGAPSGADDTTAESNDATETSDSADRVAESGDIILQVGGPMLPALARIEAERLAKKLGLTIILRDAATMSEVGRAKKSAKGSGSGNVSSIVRDERGLTEKQGIILDMMARLDGATAHELIEAGATEGKAVNWEYQQNCVTRATKGQWMMDTPKPRMELNAKGRYVATTAYRMVEVEPEYRAGVLYDVECHMVARKQLKAVVAPQPAEVFKMAAD